MLDGGLAPLDDVARSTGGRLPRLAAKLAGTSCALVCLTPLAAAGAAEDSPFSGAAALRLLVARERWLRRGQDICGWAARVRVLKNRFGPAGREVSITLSLDGGGRP